MSGIPEKVPQTYKKSICRDALAAGRTSLKDAGDFFGWKPGKVTKKIDDFTKSELLAKGWTKENLLNVAEGYEHIARITPSNPSAVERAAQLREIAKLLD